MIFIQIFLVSEDDLPTGRLKGRTGIDAPDVQDDHPRNHVNDPAGDDKGINSQKNRVDYGLGFGRRLRKKQIKNGFPEQNEHDGNPDSSPEKVHLCISHLDGVQRE